jgi:hypothetical protein
MGHVVYEKSLSITEKKLFESAVQKIGGLENLEEISTYAASKIQEAFSECFSVWMHPKYGTAGLKLPRHIEEAFDEIFKVSK